MWRQRSSLLNAFSNTLGFRVKLLWWLKRSGPHHLGLVKEPLNFNNCRFARWFVHSLNWIKEWITLLFSSPTMVIPGCSRKYIYVCCVGYYLNMIILTERLRFIFSFWARFCRSATARIRLLFFMVSRARFMEVKKLELLAELVVGRYCNAISHRDEIWLRMATRT